MSERKNIDRLFQEKFKDFEVEPSEKVWRNIESKLKEKKEDRKVIPFWMKLSGIAATLLIGLFTADSLLNFKNENGNTIVVEENNRPENTDLNSINNEGIVTSSERSNAERAKSRDWDSSGETEIQSKTSKEKEKEWKNKNLNSPNSAVTQSETDKNSNKNSSGKTIIRSEIYNAKNRNKLNWDASKNAVAQSEIEKGNASNPMKKGIKNSSSVVQGKSKTKHAYGNVLGDTNKAVVSNDSKKRDRKNSKMNPLKFQKEHLSIAENAMPNAKSQLEINPDKKPDYKLVNQNGNENQLVENKLTDNNNQIVITANNKTDTTSVVPLVPNALEELLKEKENKTVVKEPKLNKWEVSSNVAPVYFSSISNGSPLDSKFENNSKEYKTNLAYGLGVKYALNDKFSVRTGVNTVALEYNTNDIVFYQTKNAININNIDSNLQGSLIQVDNINTSEPSEITLNEVLLRKFEGKLNQKTGYIEVPLELTYKIIDKKFGMEIIGGLSTLFLNENEVSLISPGMNMNIGEADNLNKMHFSTNVGLGFKYNFLKSFQANFEPMFKYQINTFSNDSGNFKPYFFGLYTGVSYRF